MRTEFSKNRPKKPEETECSPLIGSGAEDSDKDDSDFVDSDYEIQADDDDLFVDNCDDEVIDEGVAKGKKIGKGKKFGYRRATPSVDDQSTDEEDLDLHVSNDEGDMGFKTFRPEDISNPSFKVGMMFESVLVLRKAVTEYSIKERVDIRLLRNEKKSMRLYVHKTALGTCMLQLIVGLMEW